MNTQQAVEQTQDPQGNAERPVESPAGSPPAGAGGRQVEERLKSERIQEELKTMAGWSLAPEESAIERVRTFPTPEVAALYGVFVSCFASAAGFFVSVGLAGGKVSVGVYASQLDGCWGELTDSVLAFAKQLG
jgi:pterin-4a-carbinolamine dehydratase